MAPVAHQRGFALSPIARRLWMFLLIDAVGVTAIMLLAHTPSGGTIIRPAMMFARGNQQIDSWGPMAIAADYLRRPHEHPVYEEMLEVRGVKFQYPLSSLLFTSHLSRPALNVVSWAAVLVTVWAVWWIFVRCAAGTALELDRRDVAGGLAIAGLVLTFYPIMKAYSLGQIQTWINALVALGLAAWISKRRTLAGLAIGVACAIKPTYLLVCVWGVFRRQTRFVAIIAAIFAAATGLALYRYGWADNLDYLRALTIIGRHGEAFYPNQSVNGFLNRLLGNGDSLVFNRAAFAPFNAIVYGGTLAAFGALMALALWRPRRSPDAGSALDLGLFIVSLTLTMPVAWEHHYGVLAPILAATAPLIVMRSSRPRVTIALLAACYIVASQSLFITNRLAGTWAGVLQSYVLIAAVGLLMLMYRTMASATPAEHLNATR